MLPQRLAATVLKTTTTAKTASPTALTIPVKALRCTPAGQASPANVQAKPNTRPRGSAKQKKSQTNIDVHN